uniref:Uncharacterized protein ycf35 n=1 Tax=Scinaia undulata TaxID=1884664 RepID=A0A1G4NXR6_9FLOR|nr:Hypothetical protein ycf35 [Scinaia undulata]SCW23296.1 Hypothetical protein ycf35 [Scinaia undulata]
MSHLSKIKTCIMDEQILISTLKELKLEHTIIEDKRHTRPIIDISKKSTRSTSSIHFAWDGEQYELLADSDTWIEKQFTESLVERINQKYALNIIVDESAKHGFSYNNNKTLQDGSIQIVLEKWS